MLKAYSTTSFYLDNELIDTNYLEWSARKPDGATVHKKLQALCNLRLLANVLVEGQTFSDEKVVKGWIKELQ